MDRMGKSKTLDRKDFLTLLSKSKSAAKRKFLMDNCSPQDIMAISESCQNLLHHNICVTKKQLEKLRKNKDDIRSLADKNVSIENKKDIVTQRGGFLSVLLPLAIEAIVQIIKNKKKKK